MKDIAPIVWEPKYTVRSEAIDIQHQRLFDITNQLVDVYRSGSSDLLPTFYELLDFLSKHFHTEHMAMKEANYPDLENHMQQHEIFTEEIGKYLKRYQEGDTKVAASMLAFLSRWVFDHTTSIDLKYRDYLMVRRMKA